MRRARAKLEDEPRFTVALSGGSTPRRTYELLADEPHRSGLRWERVHFFWGDERTVPPDHPDSNFGAANRALLSKLALPPQNIHRIAAGVDDPAVAAAAYEEELRRFFRLPEGGFPRFDLVLLGMGADGHTASLFPGSDAPSEKRRLALATRVDERSTYRVSLTCPVLNNAACIMFLVTGPQKAEMLRRVLEGPPEPAQYPVQRIRPSDGELIWYIDRAAAGRLRSAGGTSFA